MRNQFFLDARDYIKYSLLEDLIREVRLRQLTVVWMLTPDVANGHGKRKPRLDPTRTALNAFFEMEPRPRLADVEQYFSSLGIPCNSYGDSPHNYLTRNNRREYFAEIPGSFLDRTLLFLDPDNGVEPSSGSTTAHVRLSELRDLWYRVSNGSLLLIYQHKPRVKADLFWPQTADRVAETLGSQVGWMSRATGLSEGTIYKLQQRKQSPSLETMLALTWALGLGSLEELLGPPASTKDLLLKGRSSKLRSGQPKKM